MCVHVYMSSCDLLHIFAGCCELQTEHAQIARVSVYACVSIDVCVCVCKCACVSRSRSAAHSHHKGKGAVVVVGGVEGGLDDVWPGSWELLRSFCFPLTPADPALAPVSHTHTTHTTTHTPAHSQTHGCT